MSLIPIPLDFFTCAATLCPHQEIFQSDEVLLWDSIPHQSFSDFSKNILCPQLALYNNECRHRGCAAWGKKKQQLRLSLYWQPMIRETDIRILVSFPPVSHLSFLNQFQIAATTGPPLSYFQILLWFRSSVGLSWLQAPRSSIFYTSTSTPLWLIDSPQHKGRGADLAFLHIFTQTEFVRAHLFFRYWSGKS